MSLDLHCHTTASDGTLSPSELVGLAKEKALKGVGITDHDTIAGIMEALAAGRELGVEVVAGVELNTDYHGTEIHMLGYYPDLDSKELNESLSKLKDDRLSRMRLILKRLEELRLPVTEELLMKIAGDSSVGRPHVAQAMQQMGYVRNVKEAFELYLGQGKPAYISRFKLTPIEGIELILKAKGIPVLAHPGLVNRDNLIPELVSAGLAGIEVFHTNHNREMERKYGNIARELGLVATGGSDYHGPQRKLGIELGDRTVPMEILDRLKELKREME